MKKPFICIEGLDGVGKSETAATLAARIGATLMRTPTEELAAVRDVWRLPGAAGTINGRYLHFLSALTITSEQVRVTRQRDPVVLDRYIASTSCYHLALGASVVVDLASLGLQEPTQVVYLDCDEDVRRQRLLGRTTHTAEDLLTLGDLGAKVREQYARYPMVRIDTTHMTVDEVTDRICNLAGIKVIDCRVTQREVSP